MRRVRVRHSLLYYRNTFLAGTFAVLVLFAAVYSPSDLITFFWLIPLIYFNTILWRT
jgi:hypothetical protein